MSIVLLTFLLMGFAAGLALAWVHAWSTRRSVAAALERGSAARVLLGFPVRVGVVAGAMFALCLASPWALAGAMISFVIGVRVLLGRSLHPVIHE